MRKKKQGSIGRKLTRVFLIVFAVILIINTFIYYNINRSISQIDNVYSSNIKLNELQENLENVQTQLYQYLSTKSSDSLESYYTYEQDYRNLLSDLNKDIVNNQTALLEKNVYYMSLSYLESTGYAVEAKRGRDVSRYNEKYDESSRLYSYIQVHLNSINSTVFMENAHNYSVYREILNYIMIFSIISLVAIIIIAIGWTVSMTRSLTKPLVKLAHAATEIADGNMDIDFPIVETNDEVSAVAKACNKMISSIRSYIASTKENFIRESKLKENELIMKSDLKDAQLKYLQAQINPHFLFNSLNAGAQLAMMEGAERATMFIENLADFFRYNVRKTGSDTTLSEELKLIDNYIYILNVRFSGDIHFYKSIDDRYLSKKMPSMILQPIVENCVNHGIREMDGEGEIHLSVYGDNNKICISVTDNGKGISSENADKIMHGEVVRSDNDRDSAGVGLDNVINRLKSYYGTEDVFTISPIEKGTSVVLFLPIEKGDVDIV
ncbi:MAG: sensor histidine kinase [Suipraeoptans sp.]